MFQRSRIAFCAGLATFVGVTGLSYAALDVAHPVGGVSIANNLNIDVSGSKPSGATVTAYLKKHNGTVFVIITNGKVDVTPGVVWQQTFTTPNPNWTNGDYRGYVTEAGGGQDDGGIFFVVNP